MYNAYLTWPGFHRSTACWMGWRQVQGIGKVVVMNGGCFHIT